jgi:tryptophan 2,3-dioxygenase
MAGYSEYLKLSELLSLQRPRSANHRSELAFIVVHQVYELWFKLLIEDLGAAIASLDDDDPTATLRHLRQVHEVERLLVEQLALIDHLEPGSFSDIRSTLGTASAAESRQFATIERMSSRHLWTSFCGHGQRLGFDLPSGDDEDAQRRRTKTIAEIYRVGPGRLADICEALLDHDHAFCIWRHRHSLAAARHIGANPGTGGTAGVAYLERTMSRRFYPDLWAARTYFETTVTSPR